MKRHLALALALTLTVSLGISTSTTQADQPNKKYSSCKAVWKKYPNGIVGSKYFANRAETNGFNKPKVQARDYFANMKLAKDYVVCAVAKPDVTPSAPALISAWASTSSLTITSIWKAPANAGKQAVYDVYLNGTKINEGLTTTSYTWTGLTPSTTYTIGVTTRNPAGTSPPAEATATTINQEQADHPGRTKITYSATGVVDVTLQSTSGTQQFSNVTNPTYEFWFTPSSFVYFSVQNQNDSGDVSCSITSNGRTISSNASSGAYVIATCSGKS